MAEIDVWVQEPNKPDAPRLLGWAEESLDPKQVAAEVGIPEERFVAGNIRRPRYERHHWVLVALPPLPPPMGDPDDPLVEVWVQEHGSESDPVMIGQVPRRMSRASDRGPLLDALGIPRVALCGTGAYPERGGPIPGHEDAILLQVRHDLPPEERRVGPLLHPPFPGRACTRDGLGS
jgi:hypothetical protein